jgi:hypothetical protein
MDLNNVNLINDNTLVISKEDGSIYIIVEDIATEDEKGIFAEFRKKYPNGKSLEISLDEIKKQKITELRARCNYYITNSFYSAADGEKKLYDFTLEDQVNIKSFADKILMAKLAGQVVDKVSYYAKGEIGCHDYTSDQFLTLYNDGEAFKVMNIQKYRDVLKPKVLECTTDEEVEAITWDTEIPSNNS